jgi:hypothetical protein
MKIETVTSTKAPLSGAFYTITRVGQQSIDEGDMVIVRAQLHLPAVTEYHDSVIRPDLRFEKRLKLGLDYEYPLSRLWGSYAKDSRYSINDFVESTWELAFQAAKATCEGEIAKLEAALAARAKALVDAEADREETLDSIGE